VVSSYARMRARPHPPILSGLRAARARFFARERRPPGEGGGGGNAIFPQFRGI